MYMKLNMQPCLMGNTFGYKNELFTQRYQFLLLIT